MQDARPAPPTSHRGRWVWEAVIGALLLSAPNSWRWVLAFHEGDPERVFPEFTGHVLYASDILLAGCALVGVYEALAFGFRRWSLRGIPLAVGLLTAVGALSILSASWAFESPWRAVETGFRWLGAASVTWALATPRVPLRRVAWWLAVSGALQGWIAIVQFLYQGPIGLGMVGEMPLRSASNLIVRVPIGDGMRALAGYGLSPHPYVLAGYLLLSTGALLGLLRGRVSAWWVVLLVGCLGGTLVTFSRTAWLVQVTLFALLGFSAWRAQDGVRLRRAHLLAAVGGALLLGLVGARTVLFSALVGRVGELVDQAQVASLAVVLLLPTGRDHLAQVALALWGARPLVGVGASNFGLAFLAVEPELPTQFLPVHNVWLLAGSEMGILGLVLALALSVLPLLGFWQLRQRASRWLVVWTAVWVAYLLVWFTDYYPWEGAHGRLFTAVLLGLWSAAAAEVRASRAHDMVT